MNERRIVEQALLVSMLIKVVDSGFAQLINPRLVDAARDLHLAAGQIISQAPSSSAGKLVRRIRSKGQKCISPHLQTATQISMLGLAVHAILEHLIDQDYLVIRDGSSLSTALDILLPTLEPLANIEGNLERAYSLAATIFGCLQREGLFDGVRGMCVPS